MCIFIQTQSSAHVSLETWARIVLRETGDWGKMEAWWRLKEEVKNNLTWLTHWGLHNNT